MKSLIITAALLLTIGCSNIANAPFQPQTDRIQMDTIAQTGSPQPTDTVKSAIVCRYIIKRLDTDQYVSRFDFIWGVYSKCRYFDTYQAAEQFIYTKELVNASILNCYVLPVE